MEFKLSENVKPKKHAVSLAKDQGCQEIGQIHSNIVDYVGDNDISTIYICINVFNI